MKYIGFAFKTSSKFALSITANKWKKQKTTQFVPKSWLCTKTSKKQMLEQDETYSKTQIPTVKVEKPKSYTKKYDKPCAAACKKFAM